MITTTLPMKSKPISAQNFERFGRLAVRPDADPLAADDTFAFWSDVTRYEIDGETEIGFCTVYRQERDVVYWMERHEHTPEVLIPIDAPFTLPVMTRDGDVELFRVDLGQAVVIDTGVWHSACKPVGAAEATYFVVFRRGTPQEDVEKRDIEPVAVEGA